MKLLSKFFLSPFLFFYHIFLSYYSEIMISGSCLPTIARWHRKDEYERAREESLNVKKFLISRNEKIQYLNLK